MKVKAKKRLVLGFMGLVLLAAWATAAMQFIHRDDQHGSHPRLSEFLPRSLPGVRVVDLPLGPTEFADTTAKEKMDYDDVVNRSYASERGAFTVYVGFWAKGRRSPSHIAAHTPDRCWTLAGMVCKSKKSNFELAVDGVRICQGYWRRFGDPTGGELETVYWHIVGEGLYDYREQTPSPVPLRRAVAVVQDLFFLRRDQYFIRISSAQPLTTFQSDNCFREVLGKLAKLGLDRGRETK